MLNVGKRILKSILIFNLIILISPFNCIRDKSEITNSVEIETDYSFSKQNRVAIHANRKSVFYIYDYVENKVVKEIEIPLTENTIIHNCCLSTDNRYLIFPGNTDYKLSLHIFDLENQNFLPEIFTGLSAIAAPRISAAYIDDKPDLIYFFTHSDGMHKINFLSNTYEFMNDFAYYGPIMGVHFFKSIDNSLFLLLKSWGGDNSYSELDVYNVNSELGEKLYTLNTSNQDSIYFYNIVPDENNEYVFLAIIKIKKRFEEKYFGSYHLPTKRLIFSDLVFPSNYNNFATHLAYHSDLKEVYRIGGSNILYIIDVNTENYTIKQELVLDGKIEGVSRLLVLHDENLLLISCPDSNLLYTVDLITKTVTNKVYIEHPYTINKLY